MEGNKTIKLTTLEIEEMSTVSALTICNRIEQVVMPKSMVLDLEWFDGNWTKFED